MGLINRSTGGRGGVLDFFKPRQIIRGRCERNRPNVSHAVSNDAERCVAFVVPVLGVETVCFGLSDVPLRVCRIGVCASGHPNGPVHVGEVFIVLQRNRFARSPATALRARGRIDTDFSARWVARLGHEIIDDAMKENAVVEP